MFIIGLLISSEYGVLGDIIAGAGFIIAMISLFIGFVEKFDKKQFSGGKQKPISKKTVMAAEVIIGLLFIIWGIMRAISGGVSFGTIDSVIAAVWGIGFIVHGLTITRKRE